MTANISDGHITIDGLTLHVAAADFPKLQNINGKPADGVQAIVWDGDGLFGHIQGGGGEPFRDPAVVLPFVNSWLVTLDAKISELSKISGGMGAKKAAEAAAFVKLQADLKANEAALSKAAKADAPG
jgi:hypothetical protein